MKNNKYKKLLLLFILTLFSLSLTAEVYLSSTARYTEIVTRDEDEDMIGISNFRVTPNPFSPNEDGQFDTTSIRFNVIEAGTAELKIRNQDDQYLVNITLDVVSGDNYYVWDGYAHGDSTITYANPPEGNYSIEIKYNEYRYYSQNAVIIDVNAPQINMLSAGPQVISPNGDEILDDHFVEFLVEDVYIKPVGLLRVNIWSEINDPNDYFNTRFVDPEDGISLDTLDVSLFNDLSNGYLIAVRATDFNHDGIADVTLNSGAYYDLIIGGNGDNVNNRVRVDNANGMYKLGTYGSKYYQISGVGADDFEVPGNDDRRGYDYLWIFLMEGNGAINIYNDNGSVYELNSLFSSYYGDFQNVKDPWYGGQGSDNTNYLLPNFRYNISIPSDISSDNTMPDGYYEYRIAVTDQVENRYQESGSFIVNIEPVMLETGVEPQFISPGNLDGVQDQAVINFNVLSNNIPIQEAYFTVKVLRVMEQHLLELW